MNYLLLYLKFIDQIIINHDKRRDPIFLVASYIRFELDVGLWAWIHGSGGSSSRNPNALVGGVASSSTPYAHSCSYVWCANRGTTSTLVCGYHV
jgi:hypothetical protein